MNKRVANSIDPTDTVIAQGVLVKGDLGSDGNLWIDGDVEGDITANSNLLIGENARISGNLKAREITIAGYVEGDITAEVVISCKASARLNGRLITPRLNVDDGAALNGEVSMANDRADQEEE